MSETVYTLEKGDKSAETTNSVFAEWASAAGYRVTARTGGEA